MKQPNGERYWRKPREPTNETEPDFRARKCRETERGAASSARDVGCVF